MRPTQAIETAEDHFNEFQAEIQDVFCNKATNPRQNPNQVPGAIFCFECDVATGENGNTREVRVISMHGYPGVYGSISPHNIPKNNIYRAPTIKDALFKLKTKLESQT